MIRLSTVAAVIDALGRDEVCALLGVGNTSISNWLTQGYFPDRASTMVAIRDACAAGGFSVDERLFVERVVHNEARPTVAVP